MLDWIWHVISYVLSVKQSSQSSTSQNNKRKAKDDANTSSHSSKSRRAAKLKAWAKEATARAEKARVKYDDCIPKAQKLSRRNKFSEALDKYHEALCDRSLPTGCVTSSVLADILKCIQSVESTIARIHRHGRH